MAVPVTLTGSDQAVHTGPGELAGWSIRETSGSAAASVRFRDGTSASGAIIAVAGLGQGASETVAGAGITFRTGLYVDVVAGALEGSVLVA